MVDIDVGEWREMMKKSNNEIYEAVSSVFEIM